MLIFLHISKTGGSTLTPVIDWNYQDQTYKISRYQDIPAFIDLPDEQKLSYRALQGQVFYGIHDYIPEPCQYITMLRHPIKRLVSHYYYLNVRRAKLGETLSDEPIEAFLEEEPFQAYSQLNLIAGGRDIDSALKHPLQPNAFEQAKHNIETDFSVVGVIEQYDASLLLMKKELGWSRAFYQRQNVNKGRQQFEDFPKATQALIEQVCEPELELYEYAQKRLQVQLEAQDEQFWQDLKALKRQNQLFSTFYNLAAPIRHTKVWSIAKKILQSR